MCVLKWILVVLLPPFYFGVGCVLTVLLMYPLQLLVRSTSSWLPFWIISSLGWALICLVSGLFIVGGLLFGINQAVRLVEEPKVDPNT